MPAIVIPAPISSNHAAPVTAGGTGATTAAAARTNLDVYSKSEVTNAISQSTAKITGSIASTGSVVDSIIDMPSGFTDSNCVIAGFGYASSASEYRHGNNAFGLNERVFARAVSGNKIVVTSNYNGTIYFEVILSKIA